MSRVITVLTAECSLEFVGTGDLDECLKSGRIQRRDLHDKIHRNFEKWNKVQLSGVENDSFFSDRSITVSVDHCSNGRKVRNEFFLISGYGRSRDLHFLKLFIQIDPAGTAFFTVGKNDVLAGKILDTGNVLGISFFNI